MSFSSASLCKQSTSAVLCDGKAVTSRWTQGVFSIRNAVSLELPFSLIPFNLVISLLEQTHLKAPHATSYQWTFYSTMAS